MGAIIGVADTNDTCLFRLDQQHISAHDCVLITACGSYTHMGAQRVLADLWEEEDAANTNNDRFARCRGRRSGTSSATGRGCWLSGSFLCDSALER